MSYCSFIVTLLAIVLFRPYQTEQHIRFFDSSVMLLVAHLITGSLLALGASKLPLFLFPLPIVLVPPTFFRTRFLVVVLSLSVTHRIFVFSLFVIPSKNHYASLGEYYQKNLLKNHSVHTVPR